MSIMWTRMGDNQMINECTCEGCQRACTTRPGALNPGEAEHAAKYLNLTLQEFFDRYLVADQAVDGNWFLAPAQLHAIPGGEAPENPRGTCIFYKQGRCEIHPVKPYLCREYMHSDSHDLVRDRHNNTGPRWANNQSQITLLLKRPPDEDNLTGTPLRLLDLVRW